MRVAFLTMVVLAGVTTTAEAQGSLRRAHGRLVVDVSGDSDGVRVTVDGLQLPRHRWGVPTRVELGEHLVEARRGGEVVASSETFVPRGGDAHVELEVAPPRAVSEGPLRIEPASRPDSMGSGGGEEPARYETVEDEDVDMAFALDTEPEPEPVGNVEEEEEEEDDGEGLEIPTWVWWAGGGALAGVLLIVIIAVAASSSSGRPVEGDLMPGVLRF
jgi:hypothetical protein